MTSLMINTDQSTDPIQGENEISLVNVWFICAANGTVHGAMQMDWMRHLEVGIPALLEDGIRAIEWFGRKDVVAAPTVLFKVDGEEAWQMKSHGPLTFFKRSSFMMPATWFPWIS
ncbi:hypothetical protein CUMW_189140 [Citrus unshiu]|nr:hypothetical protein CUMW_189140 [Citrus unshiu]